MSLEATTFIELLVVGLEVATWLFLIVASVLGSGWCAPLVAAAKGFELLLTAFVLSFAYLLGVIFDRTYSSFIDWVEIRRLRKAKPQSPRVRSDVEARKRGLQPQREYVIARSEYATAQLAYVRSRIRILRSSLFNIALIAGCAIMLVWVRGRDRSMSFQATAIIGAAGLVLTVLSIMAYRELIAGYWIRVQDFYKVLATPNGKERP